MHRGLPHFFQCSCSLVRFLSNECQSQSILSRLRTSNFHVPNLTQMSLIELIKIRSVVVIMHDKCPYVPLWFFQCFFTITESLNYSVNDTPLIPWSLRHCRIIETAGFFISLVSLGNRLQRYVCPSSRNNATSLEDEIDKGMI